MRSLFVRIYLGMILTIFMGWVIADLLMQRTYTRFLQEQHRVIAAMTIRALDEALNLADLAAREDALAQASHNLLYQISIQPIKSLHFQADERQKLDAGDLVIRVNVDHWYETLEVFFADRDSNRVVVFSYGEAPGKAEKAYTIGVMLSVFSGVAVVAFLLLFPVVRRLRNLADTVRIYGEGSLSARVDEGGPAAIAKLGVAFNHMAEQLNRARVHQEIMTHAISHEVRTPLARLRLSLDMSEDMGFSQDLKSFIQDMQRDVDDLEDLSNEMLSWARLSFSREPIPMTSLDLTVITHEVQENLQCLHPEIPIRLVNLSSVPCCGNGPLLVRALANLVRNAQKYGAHHIEIQAGLDQGQACLMVDDDGPGIPVEARDRLFLPFASLDDSRSRSTGGFGLGMAIVARIADAHHGKAHILNSPLGGTRIRLTWPHPSQAQPSWTHKNKEH